MIDFEAYYNKQTPEFKAEVERLIDKLHKKILKRRKYKIRLKRKRYKYYTKTIRSRKEI